MRIIRIPTYVLIYYLLHSRTTWLHSRVRSEFAQRKAALLEAIGRKGCAMCQLYLLHNDAEKESEENKVKLHDIDSLWLNLLKFVDAGDVKVRTVPYRTKYFTNLSIL